MYYNERGGKDRRDEFIAGLFHGGNKRRTKWSASIPGRLTALAPRRKCILSRGVLLRIANRN